MKFLLYSTPIRAICISTLMFVHGSSIADLGPLPVPLSTPGFTVPPVPGLLDGAEPIVVDEAKAIVLGKALFWDMNVGSDGMACASCHFHAGSDPRTKNQIAPSGKGVTTNPDIFYLTASGGNGGPNADLKRDDFPFHKRTNPLATSSAVIFDTDDVGGSSGTFGGEFKSVRMIGGSADDCDHVADPVFHVGSLNTRRVEPRNAPSIFNAVFNHRNLWDGSANNVFNGSSQWGERDPDAGIWVMQPDGAVLKQRLELINSSLASQALSPPVSNIEMGCNNRRFADLGRKLMWRQPLEHQDVHWNDSVLAPYAKSTTGDLRKGLNTTYASLIREAFNSKYWAYGKRDDSTFGSPPLEANPNKATLPYNQFEANFSMFFALAIQLYESTLITDQTPFDVSTRDSATNNFPTDLTAQELNGMRLFREAHCNLCHIGPSFSSAAIVPNAQSIELNSEAFQSPNPDVPAGVFPIAVSRNTVNRQVVVKGTAFHDTGFADTGVHSDEFDPGNSGVDAFGNPLSFSEQYMQLLAGNTAGVVDSSVTLDNIRPCDFDRHIAENVVGPVARTFTQSEGVRPQLQNTVDCFQDAAAFPERAYLPTEAAAATALADPSTDKMLTAVKNTFKVPQLRNVELTGPYMHNGSMASLREVIEFYTRGSNLAASGFGNPGSESFNFGFVFSQSDFEFGGFGQTGEENISDIIAFLKTLTDPRVSNESAPFDHPQLVVPHGHSGDENAITVINSLDVNLAADEFIVVPAIGNTGRSASGLPVLQAFEDILTP